MSGWSAMSAVVGLTTREAARQRLWLLFAAAAIVVMVVGFQLGAVDEANKLKLAVVGITSAISFVTVLLAILVGAAQVRRDLDAKVAFLLFAKPMSRLSYLLGRWIGVSAVLLSGIAALSLVGTIMIWLTFRQVPQMNAVTVPSSWSEISPLGEVVPIADDQGRRTFSGEPGGGVRWLLRDLPEDIPAEGIDLLLRCQVRPVDYGLMIEEARVQISAFPGKDGSANARILALAPGSPYGQGSKDEPAGDGQVVVRHRDTIRNDLNQDFMRLRLPRECIAPDHSATVQLTRLESRSMLVLSRDQTLKVARPGGLLISNLLRGGLVLLAAAGMLTAFTLFLGVIGNLGVTLLGGLTLFFAGNALWTINDTLNYERLSNAVRRLLELAQLAVPDFERFQIAAALGAGQSVGWHAVANAWLYFGAYTAIFLALAWLALVRKEL